MRRVFGMSLVLLSSWISVFPARGQDATVAFPKNYRVAFQNAWVDVIRVHYGPHERVGVHDHSAYPTVYVYLNDSGPVRFDHDETPVSRLVRPPTHQGAFRVSPGRAERHSVDNVSDTSSEFLRVELKKVPLGSGLEEFRGHAPTGEPRTMDAVEFTSPQVSVERTVCVGGGACEVKRSEMPSLLIALGSLKVGGTRGGEMTVGDVRWMAERETVALLPTGDAPVQVLRILLGSSR